MPQTVYKQVTDADGNVTFEPTEVPTQEELALLQAKLKAANDEAAAKRHELKRVREAQPAQVVADQDEATPAAPVTPAKPTQPVASVTPAPAYNEDEIVEKAISRLNAQKAQETAAAAEIDALLAKHGLPAEDYAQVLIDSKNPALTAERLGRDRLKFAPAHSGREPRAADTLSAAVKAFRSMGMKHPDDPEK